MPLQSKFNILYEKKYIPYSLSEVGLLTWATEMKLGLRKRKISSLKKGVFFESAIIDFVTVSPFS